MPLKAMMAKKTKENTNILNAYALKSDDGEKDQEETNILAYAFKAMMADLKRPLKPD